MNVTKIFQDFNPSKFLVFVCLLVFSFLFALRLDGIIQWSYWIVFLPLWIWKIVVIMGSTSGVYIWCNNPHYRSEGDTFIHFKAMVICAFLHLPLLVFEILVCDKLQSSKHLWTLIFIPLLVMSLASIGLCIWAVKNDRAFEMELFCAVNVLQFIFIALRLDGFILWSWVIVFIPLWIVMCVAMIGVLYAVILAIILMKSIDIMPEQRRNNICTALTYTFLVIPLLVFEILLANKLDYSSKQKFIAITVPLIISFITLIFMSFGSRGGNHWWFGMRKDFCQLLLEICPLLQEYGNISYKMRHDTNDTQSTPTDNESIKSSSSHSKKQLIDQQPRIVVPPHVTIEMPD